MKTNTNLINTEIVVKLLKDENSAYNKVLLYLPLGAAAKFYRAPPFCLINEISLYSKLDKEFCIAIWYAIDNILIQTRTCSHAYETEEECRMLFRKLITELEIGNNIRNISKIKNFINTAISLGVFYICNKHLFDLHLLQNLNDSVYTKSAKKITIQTDAPNNISEVDTPNNISEVDITALPLKKGQQKQAQIFANNSAVLNMAIQIVDALSTCDIKVPMGERNKIFYEIFTQPNVIVKRFLYYDTNKVYVNNFVSVNTGNNCFIFQYSLHLFLFFYRNEASLTKAMKDNRNLSYNYHDAQSFLSYFDQVYYGNHNKDKLIKMAINFASLNLYDFNKNMESIILLLANFSLKTHQCVSKSINEEVYIKHIDIDNTKKIIEVSVNKQITEEEISTLFIILSVHSFSLQIKQPELSAKV